MEQHDDVREADIAIVGMACRFPGADTVEEFWRNLCAGRETTTFFGDDELLAAGVSPDLVADPRYVKAGQILSGIEMFDADVFGIPSEEAQLLDPQQRHFLECALAALEDSGYDPETHPGAIGVYAGAGLNTYLLRNLSDRFRSGSTLERYRLMLASDKDFLATRVAYKLNLRGPAVSVNTACSTSLVAVHMACVSLLGGECDLALAGAAHIRVPHVEGYLFQEGMILSPDGRCRAFDASAQGTIVGSGVGVVVLKRLADALADGDWIHAVVKGTAINNDGGAKAGYTAPSVRGQAAVIVEAQALAGCGAETISYVEAHGTGTPLGDPIEIAALTQAFTPRPAAAGPCSIGSVKTNIGHLDAASGIAGLIKTALMLRYGRLVPSLHFDTPNPDIDFDSARFSVATTFRQWPQSGPAPRRAGVSSFGIGGTNAHVILEEAPVREPVGVPADDWQLLVISAASPAALDEVADNLARHLAIHRDALNLADVAFTLAVGRRAHAYRRALVCRDIHDAALTLTLGDDDRVVTGRVVPGASDSGRQVTAVRESWDAGSTGVGETDAARRGRLTAAGRLWTSGIAVDWSAFYPDPPAGADSAAGRRRMRVPLPAYPFQRRRFWVEPVRQVGQVGQVGTVGTADDDALPPTETLRHQVEAAQGNVKEAVLVDFIQSEVAAMLGLDDARAVDPDQSLFDIGLDSLNLIEVAAKLGAELDRDVRASVFAEHPTIRAYAEKLAASLDPVVSLDPAVSLDGGVTGSG
ncbi:type I polyketide synthase [Frankia sp. Cr2]|uniref:type I polyketide synthase n=1 Tax=Frankia sp. Cr2 TaxID=3073932 RepID=UPI002AD5060C|nr:beta-ketoacyl synthase N-terminal-like domain-containing protein [Frankia sp. Cr2]